MINLDNAAKLARDPSFRDRITVAVVRQAFQTLTNPASQPTQRGYARAVIIGPENYVGAFAWAVVIDETLSARGSTDKDISDQVLIERIASAWAVISATPSAGA